MNAAVQVSEVLGIKESGPLPLMSAMALDVWGSADAARGFMCEAHPLPDGRCPINVVLASELGRPVLEGILGRLQYGSAV